MTKGINQLLFWGFSLVALITLLRYSCILCFKPKGHRGHEEGSGAYRHKDGSG